MQSEGVFQLIQSMSKAEKRYFHRFAEMTGGDQKTNYLSLFAELERLEEDDTEILEKRLAGTPMAENLLVYRNRLQALVMRSLRTLYAGRGVASEIRQLLEEVAILYERRLLSACTKRIEKALDLAYAHEQETLLLELLAWKRKLVSQSPLPQQDSLLDEIRAEESTCLARLDTERSCADAHERVRVQARLRPVAQAKGGDQPKGKPIDLPAEEPPHSNFVARVHHHAARAIVALSKGDPAAAGEGYAHIMGLWEQSRDHIPVHPDLYLQCFNNYLGTLLIVGTRQDEFRAAVQRLRQMPALPRHTRVDFQVVAYHQELSFSINFSDYDTTLRLVGEIEAWIKANSQEILVPWLLAFYFNITMFFFVYGEHSRANRWLSRILNQPGRAERRDIRNFARIFQVLLQHELQNIDLNEYLVRSAYRYLNRKDQLYDFERAIFTLVRKLGAAHGAAARQAAYEEFRATLEGLQAQQSLGRGELLLWVESKLAGQPMRKIFEQKLAENQSAARMR